MDEDIVIPIIVFSFILSLVWMILNYRKWKLQHRQENQKADSSLSLSELKEMMREAAAEANDPIIERIELMEALLRQARAPRLGPAQQDALIEEIQQEHEEAPVPSKRRGVT